MSQDHRHHERINLEQRVFIELVSPEMGSSQPGEIATCSTVDISPEGLQVRLEKQLTVDSILQIGVEMPAGRETLYLAAEVVWCRPAQAPASGYSAGLRVLNADGSDVGDWRERITRY